MLYTQVVFGLPVEGPFDYIVPTNLSKKIKVGVRVGVSFRTQKLVGYTVKITKKTDIKNLKPIIEVIDGSPILDKNMLLLAKQLSDYYSCSWGQAIETILPQRLRKEKAIQGIESAVPVNQQYNSGAVLIHDLDSNVRWDIYLTHIKDALENKSSVIILLPDINLVLKAKEIIAERLGISPKVLYRKQPQELEEWLAIKRGEASIVIGTRSAIFAPLNNLGLIIIDEEQDSVYKQDQVPHYNAREVAFMRMNIEKAKLILGSPAPSLEMFNLAQRNKIKYTLGSPKPFPEIRIVDTVNQAYNTGQKIKLSKYLQDAILANLNSQGKTLLFLNRKGFATFASCHNCGMALKCPRCNIALVYHFKDNILSCHYCNFKISPPNICPSCNSGYIKYSGIGIEKIESELSRIFPQARIIKLDKQEIIDTKEADIFISTQSIIKKGGHHFNLIGVLSIDNSLNRLDFRSSEKTFALLAGIIRLTEGKVIIQTGLARHHCFQALMNKDTNLFYNEELKQRKQLNFPPYRHIGLVKLRGQKEAKVKETSDALFKELAKRNKNRRIKIMSVNPAQPAKLRGNFYWQIMIKSDDAKKMVKFLKKHLKDFLHSGIIVTVDIDPI